MNKKLIRLTESDLHKIVKESVNKVLNNSDKRAKITEGEESWAWYGDTKPLEDLRAAAHRVYLYAHNGALEGVSPDIDDEYYEGYYGAYTREVEKWASEIESFAERILQNNPSW